MVRLMKGRADILACSVTGHIDREDVHRLFAAIDSKSAGGNRLRVYAEIGDLSMMSLLGLPQHLKSFADRKHLLDQIDKAAVVTDNPLVRQALQFKSRAAASFEVRLFSTRDVAQARRWIQT